ncbi:MAG: TetR/AcrR family transcriptional regulator [Pseudodesulfovibrio sp.]|uniref:TetR family transcriptional regulator n=1 Tax=Pseudodesulfovibrio indicus TaxID=1716143 RepID=A0A126QSR3_9BACT|nr:TetR/AcrR family transcriptional regulator [Pseudodesulfovibrio indicus]AMK13004.1 TetR family transcriptional regulator [Pseudodesulfovibrio indicus]TDT87278.1 TetR family transcriptional regulator [Pseudodesulfovibrio indicus]
MAHLNAVPKVIPIRNKEITKEKLVKAVGKVIAEVGFQRLGVNQIAREAGVDKKLIYRYFSGLQGLVAEYGRTLEFWPSGEELMGGDSESIRSLPPNKLFSLFFKRYLRAILRRPLTLEILAWEAIERNDLTRALEENRVRTALEFFELMDEDPPEEVDLTALVLIMAGAMNFLAVRSRKHRTLGGVSLQSEEGWKRIEDTVDLMLERTLKK